MTEERPAAPKVKDSLSPSRETIEGGPYRYFTHSVPAKPAHFRTLNGGFGACLKPTSFRK